MNTSRTTDARRESEGRLLRLIWSRQVVSRAELARTTGWSASTVSGHVRTLLDSGLVAVSRKAQSTGGRPASLLQFQDDHRRIVGVEMGAGHITVVLTNLRGRVAADAHLVHDVQGDPHGTMAHIASLVERVCEGAGIEVRSLVGIGMGVPCPVDLEDPDTLSQRILAAWADTRPASWLQARFGVPVVLENDANCGAIAEHWWGAARDVGTFAYIKMGTGVGAGLYLDGQLYRGAGGVAGEIGHVAVTEGGRRRCRCGLTGCLEAHVGRDALLDEVRRRRGLPATAALTLAEVVDDARRGDEAAVEVIEHAGHVVGTAISNLLNLYNPRRVFVGGELSMSGDVFFRPLRRTVLDRTLWNSVADVEIVPTSLGPAAAAVGAATLLLQRALDDLTWLSGAASS